VETVEAQVVNGWLRQVGTDAPVSVGEAA
jgi:hypothetical protein